MKIKINSKKGVGIGVVMMLLLTLGIVVGSVINLNIRTHHTQQDAYVWLDAKNTAEALSEYGFAQLVDRFSKNSAFGTNALAPNQSPLTVPSEFYTTFGLKSGAWRFSNIDAQPYDASSTALWNTRPTELIGGVVPPGQWKFIDGNAPGNEFDPLKNKMVYVRNVKVFAKATAKDWRGRKNTSYVAQELQVRDAPLFAHAIFYNMDMEIAPGPLMNVSSSVHTNYDAYVTSGNGLNFNGTFTAAGNIYHDTFAGIGKAPASGDVRFINSSNTLTSMNVSGNWLDSTNTDFRALASQRWGGNVQSAAHGIPKQNPVAISDYKRDNPATATLDDQMNYGYQLIQPTVATTASNYNKDIEEQKFSYKAGLTVDVNTSTGTYTLYTYERDSAGKIVYDAATKLPKRIALNLNSGTAGIDFIKTETYATSGGNIVGGMYDYRRARNTNLIRIDVAKLKTALDRNNSADWGGVATQKPDLWWNGIVYVKAPTNAPRSTDGVEVASNAAWGVQLNNGGALPNPTYTQSKGIYGMSVATNTPMYLVGHYNADGNSATGSSGDPDSANEPPAALAADAITILSTAWQNSDSDEGMGSRAASSFTEVSAALLTGLVPSDNANNNAYSGGVENLPRFLESWTNRTFRYRGSMVALYESEVAREPWGASNVYDAPNRDWAFDKKYASGNYPPGTPNTRSYRRINFREINKATWDSEMAALKAQMGI
jgi:hypothetical protein